MKLINILIITFFLCLNNTYSQVNIKNGNFYVSFTDAEYKGTEGAIEKIQRTYNSKSTQIGWFGFGWGSRLETKMSFYPDGNVMIREHGAGETNIFISDLEEDILVEEMIDLLIDIEIEQEIIEDISIKIAEQREKYKDLNKRYNSYDKYKEKEYLENNLEAPENMTWQSFNRGDQQLVFDGDYFIRTNRKGEKEYFDLQGHLVKYELNNGNYTEVVFKDNKVSKLITKKGQVVDFKTTEGGFINLISYKYQGKDYKAVFKYKGNDLVFSEDTAGNQYGFVYDKKHNLIETIYNPTRLKGISKDARYMFYDDKTFFTNKIIERDSTEIKEYSYKKFYDKNGALDDKHYDTTVSILKKGQEDPRVTNYEYFIGTKADGSRFTQKIVTSSRNIREAKVYHETCSYSPIRIEKGNLWTTFKYDKNCNLLEKKKSTGEFLRLKHHPVLKKMIEVQQDENTFYYDYDKRGNIIYGKKNDEEPVYFTYTPKDKIQTMKNGDNLLNFEYNKFGKPTKISIEEVGSMNITYDNIGNIESVDSDQGYEMTIKVTQTFQNLLTIVKPANLNYDM